MEILSDIPIKFNLSDFLKNLKIPIDSDYPEEFESLLKKAEKITEEVLKGKNT